MDLWEKCKGNEKIASLQLEAWRVVEDQSTSSTRQLVDSLEEHAILEHALDNIKPPVFPNCVGFDYLLFTPFRYPPLQYGSRFGQHTEHSIWDGSRELITALAEKAYYRFVFLLGSEISDNTDRVSKTAFCVKIKTKKGIDFTAEPFSDHREMISSPTSWKASQVLGKNMRKAEIEAFTYFSARSTDADGMNVGAFSCRAFGSKKPFLYKHLIEFSSRSSVEFVDDARQDKYIFKREDFCVEGDFPMPADFD